MHLRRLLPALALLASACTFAPSSQDGGMEAALHLPIVEHHWQVAHAVLPNETKVCTITSGYNGLTVYLSDLHGDKDIAVKSNRRMEPGATLTVNAGGGSFETYGIFFPPKIARELVDNLAKGGKAYLEWSEFSGSSSRERMHVQNIVPLDDFAANLKECRDSLK